MPSRFVTLRRPGQDVHVNVALLATVRATPEYVEVTFKSGAYQTIYGQPAEETLYRLCAEDLSPFALSGPRYFCVIEGNAGQDRTAYNLEAVCMWTDNQGEGEDALRYIEFVVGVGQTISLHSEESASFRRAMLEMDRADRVPRGPVARLPDGFDDIQEF